MAKIANPAAFVEEKRAIKDTVVVFSKSYCPACSGAKSNINATGLKFEYIELDSFGEPRNGPVQQALQAVTGKISTPQVFVNGSFVGGGDEIAALAKKGTLKEDLIKLGAK